MNEMLGPREILESLDPSRIGRGHHDHEAIPSEHLRHARDQSPVQCEAHPALIGRSEDVGRGSELELRRELLRAREVEPDREAGSAALHQRAEVAEGIAE